MLQNCSYKLTREVLEASKPNEHFQNVCSMKGYRQLAEDQDESKDNDKLVVRLRIHVQQRAKRNISLDVSYVSPFHFGSNIQFDSRSIFH